MKKISPCRYLYQGEILILLEDPFAGDEDRFLLDDAGNIMKWKSVDELRTHSESLAYADSIVWIDDCSIDMDRFVNQLNELQPWVEITNEECELLLDGWNFIEDILRTIKRQELIDELLRPDIHKLYCSIFFDGTDLGPAKSQENARPLVLPEAETVMLKTTLLSVVEKLENLGVL